MPNKTPFSHFLSGLQETTAKQDSLPDLTLREQLLLPLVILVVAIAGVAFSHFANFFGTLWPANAIMLVALLRCRRTLRNYGSIILGGGLAMLLAARTANDDLGLGLILAAANILEIATAWSLLTMFRIGAGNLTSFRNLLIFILLAGGFAPITSAIISAIAFGTQHNIPWFLIWRTWYPGHALGMIIVAPFLISVMSAEWETRRIKRRLGEAAGILTLIFATGVCAILLRPIIFVIAPLILYATIRFGLIGATTATLLTSILSSLFVVFDVGAPLISHADLPVRIFALQVFLAITALWSLPTAALLSERDRLLGDLSRANERLAAESDQKSDLVVGLRRHLAAAEENERLRLSHELHDQAGQSLIAAILELNQIDPLTAGAARERLQSVRKRMEEMGKTLHRIAWELRPPSIDELGLRKALASYIAEWSAQCGTEVDFHCDDRQLDDVPREVGTAVYRVLQEGLTNIVKHAGRPTSVSVVIRRLDTVLHVIIEDNGCGFDVGALAAKTGNRGLGLDGMRERLTLIGGTLEIESARGAGTTIFARIALEGQRTAA